MPPRVHMVAGNGEIVTQAAADLDDEGAPPQLPAGGRVHTVNTDGDVAFASTSPQSELDLAAKREAAAARIAERKAAPAPRASGAPGSPGSPIAPAALTEREIRLRCLDIASRGGETDPMKVLADARAMFAFVENG